MLRIEVLSSPLPPLAIAALRRLARAAFGDDFTENDLAHALGGAHVVATYAHNQSIMLAHAAVVPRTLHVGERPVRVGYVEAVASQPDRQGEGLGSRVMQAAAELICKRYDIGALSTGEHEFYERLGWEAWRGSSYIIGRDGRRRRSADEDDGIMVLRCAASRDIDLAADIACHDRPGDAW